MKKIIFYSLLFFTVLRGSAQNIGINDTDPGSTLSVNGSWSAGYMNVTSSYTLTGSDYVVVFSGSANETLTLPAALAAGNGNFKGRVYKIKNNSNFQLKVDAAGAESINGEDMAILQSGAMLEIISTGLVSGTTWEALSGLQEDALRKTLQLGSCASCAAYNAANSDSWVEITKAEYQLLLFSIPGAEAFGATAASMSSSSSDGFPSSATITQNFANGSTLPPGHYPLALSIRTGFYPPSNMTGLHLKLSNSSQSAGYAMFGLPFSSALPAAGQTTYYFVLKRPSLRTAIGNYSNMAIYQSSSSQLGYIQAGGGTMYFSNGNTAYPSNPTSYTPLFQVLATGYRSW
ncbi:MAG: hypothetical protein EOP49_31955 [Sphingobacteriales bacterium]|nr:MAG: hypothetical protein EOP49_31955 [Sphingobacteriales bacterium]